MTNLLLDLKFDSLAKSKILILDIFNLCCSYNISNVPCLPKTIFECSPVSTWNQAVDKCLGGRETVLSFTGIICLLLDLSSSYDC